LTVLFVPYSLDSGNGTPPHFQLGNPKKEREIDQDREIEREERERERESERARDRAREGH